jgi:hypothetical protein
LPVFTIKLYYRGSGKREKHDFMNELKWNGNKDNNFDVSLENRVLIAF